MCLASSAGIGPCPDHSPGWSSIPSRVDNATATWIVGLAPCQRGGAASALSSLSSRTTTLRQLGQARKPVQGVDAQLHESICAALILAARIVGLAGIGGDVESSHEKLRAIGRQDGPEGC